MTKLKRYKCWYCGSKDFEDLGEYVQCRQCNATNTDLPRPGSYPATPQRDPAISPPGKRTVKTGSPSGTVKRRAAKKLSTPEK